MGNGLKGGPGKNQRADALDVLRCVLAAWVLCSHFLSWAQAAQGSERVPRVLLELFGFLDHLLQPATETHPAVLAFIVLSGYCIHRNGCRDASFLFSSYARRRAFRILPVYVLARLTGVVCLAISAASSEPLASMI